MQLSIPSLNTCTLCSVVTQLAINVMIFQYSQKHKQLRKIHKYLQWHDFNVNHGLFNYILTLQYMHIM